MGEWKGPWECETCLSVRDKPISHIISLSPFERCNGPFRPLDRRAPDPRVVALVEAGKLCRRELVRRHGLPFIDKPNCEGCQAIFAFDAALAALKEET